MAGLVEDKAEKSQIWDSEAARDRKLPLPPLGWRDSSGGVA